MPSHNRKQNLSLFFEPLGPADDELSKEYEKVTKALVALRKALEEIPVDNSYKKLMVEQAFEGEVLKTLPKGVKKKMIADFLPVNSK